MEGQSRGSAANPGSVPTLRFLLSTAQLEFYGGNGHEYRLEHSTNLTGWTPFSGWVTGTNQYLLWEVGSFVGPATFWRATARPQP